MGAEVTKIVPLHPLVAGVMLTVQDTSDIGEWSNMTRNLCVELTDIGDGLEREVVVNLVFTGEEYAMMCKFAIVQYIIMSAAGLV